MAQVPPAPRPPSLWPVTIAAVGVAAAAAAVGAWTQGVHAAHLLVWAGIAGAGAFVAGLVVPAAISRRDRRSARLASERALASKIETDLRAVMRPLSMPADPGAGPGGHGSSSPAALLRPERQMVGFTGRIVELRKLRVWARDSQRGIVQLITGPGGSGKTRLAIEFAARLQEEGWQCGLLQGSDSNRAIAAIAASGKETLLIVDYAEARADLEVLLEALAAHSGDPTILVLLLARTFGEWWQPYGPLRRHAPVRDVLADTEIIELNPLTNFTRGHHEVFNAALTAFASYYGIPAPATILRPIDKDTPVLLLHTAALTAVLSTREGAGSPAEVAATQDIVQELLGHESKYWSDTLAARDLNHIGVGADTCRQVVAIAGLLGADNEQHADELLRRLPVLTDAPALTVQVILTWFREVYPANSSWLGSIQPDLVLEYLVTSVFANSEKLVSSALASLTEDQAEHALVVLSRALDHYPARAAVLLGYLLSDYADLLVVSAIHLAGNLNSPALCNIIATVLGDALISHEVLSVLAADLGQVPILLVPIAVIVHMQMAVTEIIAGNVQAAVAAANTLTSLAHQLYWQDLPGAAENVSRAAVALWQAVEEAEPGNHQAELASALILLSKILNNLLYWREARPIAAKAVELYRAAEEAEEAEPGSNKAHRADALRILSMILHNLRRDQEALPLAMAAVQLYQAAEDAEPGSNQAQRADALKNLAVILSRLGRDQEARPLAVEAVELFRAVEDAEPGSNQAHRADALKTLAGILRRLGRDQEARPLAVEAVELFRAVEDAEPGSYRGYLADALIELARILRLLGGNREARPLAVEAVELFRAVEDAEPGSYRSFLAEALIQLAGILTNLGRDREARPLAVEAVELYRAIEDAEPGSSRDFLAEALIQLAGILTNLGRDREARPLAVEAVELYRAIEDAEPGSSRGFLAEALGRLGAILRRVGDIEAALTITKEAIKVYRALYEIDPANYSSKLAERLTDLIGILLDLGRLEEAEAVRQQADFYGAPTNRR
jgi:Tetratricopeptide repeat